MHSAQENSLLVKKMVKPGFAIYQEKQAIWVSDEFAEAGLDEHFDCEWVHSLFFKQVLSLFVALMDCFLLMGSISASSFSFDAFQFIFSPCAHVLRDDLCFSDQLLRWTLIADEGRHGCATTVLLKSKVTHYICPLVLLCLLSIRITIFAEMDKLNFCSLMHRMGLFGYTCTRHGSMDMGWKIKPPGFSRLSALLAFLVE